MKYKYDLSIIIPAYNESKRIVKTMTLILDYLKTIKLKTEIIVVDDGSSDNTVSIVDRKYKNNKHVRIIQNGQNRGKGYSVKNGVLNAFGRYNLFTDADNSTPIEELDKFIPHFDPKKILIGSRYKKSDSVVIKKQPWYRILISRWGNYLIRFFLSLDIKDTQCGFKVFPHEIAYFLFSLQTIDRFGFDFEILSLACLSNIKIQEIPVNWFDSTFSRVRPIKAALATFVELLKIKTNIWMRYYHKKAQTLH